MGRAIVVLVAFNGLVDALIPLYAIGVFTSITLSQAGMVRHWLRDRSSGWRRSAEMIEPDDRPGVTHPTFPAERDADLDGDSGADQRREHAVAIGLVLELEPFPAWK